MFALFCWASGGPPFCSHRRRHIHSHGRRHFLTRCVGAFPLNLWEALLFAATVVVTSFHLVLAFVRWTSGRPPLCSRRRHHILLPGVGVVVLDGQTKIKNNEHCQSYTINKKLFDGRRNIIILDSTPRTC